MINKYIQFLIKIGEEFKYSTETATIIAELITFLTILAISILVFFLCKLIINKGVTYLNRKTDNIFVKLVVSNKVFTRLCLLVPTYIIRETAIDAMPTLTRLQHFVIILTRIYEVFVYTRIIDSILNVIHGVYNSYEMSKSKPIKGVIQVLKFFAYIICVLLILAVLTNKQLSNILIGLGTLSAVLMLVFKDPILGFVGSIQLTINDMLRIGDWIVMTKNNADGEVFDIGLTTVKVQNWDNTITTIPTYSLISESFTNWRGMSESGGRRIARSIIIDADTVKFCTPEMLERFKKYQLVERYISDKEAEITFYNKENNIDTSNLVNGRRQTNIGIFRAYLREYLMSNPNLNHNMTLMVRQLTPTEYGIPIQVYAFSANKEWKAYENIQSDIFDHIYSVVPMFDLRVYQKPSSNTITRLGEETIDNLKH